MKKESFYKTEDEKLLKLVIDSEFNDEIGGRENSILDGDPVGGEPIDEQSLIDLIVERILSKREYLENEFNYQILEAKHIRFIGKKRIIELVEHRVKYRHEHEGKWSWEK